MENGTGNRLGMFLLGATLALGFGWAAYMISGAMVKMKQESLIRVKGVAETKIKSNFATWQCGIWFRSVEIKAGYDGLEKYRQSVLDYLKTAKIPTGEYSVSPIEIYMEYKPDEKGNKTNTIEFYTLKQSVVVNSSDVAKVDAAAHGVSDLIKNGVELKSGRPAFVNTDIEAIKMELLAKATKNAYERAQTLAANSNGMVGRLNSASQGVFQITPVNSTDVSDSGAYDTSTIDKSIKAVVTLEFQVAK